FAARQYASSARWSGSSSVVKPEGTLQLVERDDTFPAFARMPGGPVGERSRLEHLDLLFQRLVHVVRLGVAREPREAPKAGIKVLV
ncbi:MAG TPA: hypothetical protein VL546_09545, partial [Steroidobacteraceae bacterium]|nr:hypothetical protein [Steroidobacteraceae bacterium]